MAPRSTWKGYVKLSLINVAVKAYTASNSTSGTIRLNQLHEECHSRIKYQKHCPVHGEVPSSEIVSGYEYSKGQYVVVDPKELDSVRKESDKAVNIREFVAKQEVPLVYLSGKTYYLVPSDPISQKPYRLMYQAMLDQDQHAIAQVVMSGKDELVMLHPYEDLIAMSVLNYETKIKQATAFEDELADVGFEDEELALTKQLMENLQPKEFEITRYEDTYTDRLRELIEAKVEGRELVSPPDDSETADVINLMDALRMSVEQVAKPGESKPKTQKSAARKTGKKKATKKKVAKTTSKKKAATKKKLG